MQGKALPGFRDFYPEEAAFRNRIFATWRAVAGRYGFEEYDGPPLEPLDLYTQKSGAEIVGQLYEFTDKGERRVALRPEMTPTLARMVGARAQALKKPIRWFSMPQLFRYERQQRGRLREHFQLNMDIIGEAGPLADAEVIAASIDVMREFGFGPKDFRVKVSHRGAVATWLKQTAGVQEDEIPGVLIAADKFGSDTTHTERLLVQQFNGDMNRVAQVLTALVGLSDSPPSVWNLVDRDVEMDDEGGVHVSSNLSLGDCLKHLDSSGLSEFVDVDFGIVRGLAYYTGIVFELFDARETLRAICGGGRYDNLLKQVSGMDLPCVGFGMGDVVLGEMLKERQDPVPTTPRLDVFVVVVGADDVPVALGLVHALRDQGLAVEYALHRQAVRKQLELAAARGARRAVIIGPDERRNGHAVVRDFNSGAETKVPLDAVAAAVAP